MEPALVYLYISKTNIIAEEGNIIVFNLKIGDESIEVAKNRRLKNKPKYTYIKYKAIKLIDLISKDPISLKPITITVLEENKYTRTVVKEYGQININCLKYFENQEMKRKKIHFGDEKQYKIKIALAIKEYDDPIPDKFIHYHRIHSSKIISGSANDIIEKPHRPKPILSLPSTIEHIKESIEDEIKEGNITASKQPVEDKLPDFVDEEPLDLLSADDII